MISEGHVLPFAASWFPPGSWLVLAPHADDETFGMGGALLKAAWLGLRTQVLIMTDGAQGGSAADLVQVREAEARSAGRMLGVAAVDFFHEPDRGLNPTPELAQKLAAHIATAAPALLFFPGLNEPHPDHRATALLAWEALKLLPAARRPLPVSYEISVQGSINLLVDITDWMPQKQDVIRLYHSQLQENRYLELSAALNKLRTYTLGPTVEYAEGFHLFSPEDLQQSLPELQAARMAVLAQA